MTIKEAIGPENPGQFHIFDSHQERMAERGVQHNDRDFEAYSYNIHKNNKPKPGDAFLYRRPGKSTKNRKFNIYGGGVIEFITEPDPDGNVLAKVRSPFRLAEPLEQDTSKRLEEFKWTSKKKKPDSWDHFWNQYGMNVIDEHDFFGLVGDMEFIGTGNTNPYNAGVREAAEELSEPEEQFDLSGFQLKIEQDSTERAPEIKPDIHKPLTGRHVDFKKLQARKTSIGKAGEYLVLEMLREQYEGTDTLIEHVAETEGDGYGYDIRVTTPDKKEIRIEVKTTKESYIDGFYLTPRELNAARQCLFDEASKTKSYHIYRVYNFDAKKKTANIKIYDFFDGREFRLAPTCWKVHIR